MWTNFKNCPPCQCHILLLYSLITHHSPPLTIIFHGTHHNSLPLYSSPVTTTHHHSPPLTTLFTATHRNSSPLYSQQPLTTLFTATHHHSPPLPTHRSSLDQLALEAKFLATVRRFSTSHERVENRSVVERLKQSVRVCVCMCGVVGEWEVEVGVQGRREVIRGSKRRESKLLRRCRDWTEQPSLSSLLRHLFNIIATAASVCECRGVCVYVCVCRGGVRVVATYISLSLSLFPVDLSTSITDA